MPIAPLPPDVIRTTIDSLRECVARLVGERTEIDGKIGQLEKNIAAMEGQLADIDAARPARRPKGQNLEDVKNALSRGPQTVAELAKSIPAAPSSVQAVFKKHADEFILEQTTGRWRLRSSEEVAA